MAAAPLVAVPQESGEQWLQQAPHAHVHRGTTQNAGGGGGLRWVPLAAPWGAGVQLRATRVLIMPPYGHPGRHPSREVEEPARAHSSRALPDSLPAATSFPGCRAPSGGRTGSCRGPTGETRGGADPKVKPEARGGLGTKTCPHESWGRAGGEAETSDFSGVGGVPAPRRRGDGEPRKGSGLHLPGTHFLPACRGHCGPPATTMPRLPAEERMPPALGHAERGDPGPGLRAGLGGVTL